MADNLKMVLDMTINGWRLTARDYVDDGDFEE